MLASKNIELPGRAANGPVDPVDVSRRSRPSRPNVRWDISAFFGRWKLQWNDRTTL
jgi:hypothetical protein